jgi:hypothetical protein
VIERRACARFHDQKAGFHITEGGAAAAPQNFSLWRIDFRIPKFALQAVELKEQCF